MLPLEIPVTECCLKNKVAHCCENYEEVVIYSMCGQNQRILMSRLLVHVLTSRI